MIERLDMRYLAKADSAGVRSGGKWVDALEAELVILRTDTACTLLLFEPHIRQGCLLRADMDYC